MLTPIDIHYLAGLLTLVSQPDSVEVELGAMVDDHAAEKERDVDVLITYSDVTNGLSVLTGIEVKKHSRPLTVEHVEQLFAKLSDMPSLRNKGIVSASGYTAGAVKKAKAHGLDLFLLSDWNRGADDFGHIAPNCQFTFVNKILTWIGAPRITYRSSLQSEGMSKLFKSNPRLYFESARPIVKHLSDLNSSLPSRALNTLIRDKNFSIPNDSISVSVNLTFASAPVIKTREGNALLSGASVQGVVRWEEVQMTSAYKSLYKHGESIPHVTCAITETKQGNLYGLTFSNSDRVINLVSVSVSDRNKKKIFKRKLKSIANQAMGPTAATIKGKKKIGG